MPNRTILLSKDDWVCALVCKKDKDNSFLYVGHAMIFMEGIGPYGQRFLKRFHITGDKVASVDEDIDLKPSIDLSEYYLNAKTITANTGKLLQQKVEADIGKELPFDVFFAEVKGKNEKTLNCLKWCKLKFSEANIAINPNLNTTSLAPVKAAQDKKFFLK